jgi:hypothetical protein
MSRVRRDERGQVIVLGAVMIPVLLLIAALVVDVGDWYTHKRQLQNRADAAAFAAGVTYAKNWKTCVQTGDTALKASTAQTIGDFARQYAGDPDATDYAGGVLPSPLQNTQIANQANLDVVVNSTTYDNGTDYSDDYDGNPATNLGNPCYLHTTGDSLSAPGYWTDVKVKERDLPSLFGKIGLPLSRNGASARVDVRPALSGNQFLPIAVPDNVVTKVQVRYIDQCTGTELLKRDLAPLPSGQFNGYQSKGGGSLWALQDAGTPTQGDRAQSAGLSLPPYDPVNCPSSEYRPIGEQVRVASSPDINLDSYSCAQLQSLSFADCFNRLSDIRIWAGSNPDVEPRVHDVRILGGCAGPGDAYFGVLPFGDTGCKYDVSLDVDWGDRDDGQLNVPANFTVNANGIDLTPAGGSGGEKTYTSSGGAMTAPAGPTTIHVTLKWADTNTSHTWRGTPCTNSASNTPCKYGPASLDVHRLVVGVDSTNTTGDPTATGAVESVHTSLAGVDAAGNVGSSFDNWHPSSSGGSPCISPCQIYPTIGIRSALVSGTLTTLRTGSSQGSQLVDCDPNVSQILTLMRDGCGPWFGPNKFTDPNWWNTATQSCPPKTNWFTYSAAMPYTNSSGNPWRCVLNQGGSIVGQAGDWMAVATDNCNAVNPGGTQCTDFKTDVQATLDKTCGNYDGKPAQGGRPADPNGWVQRGGDSADPRIVQLFVVPYQALKNVSGSGSQAGIPILRFASFYVMNWRGQNAGSDDPCPDPDFKGSPANLPSGSAGKGTILGVFDSTVSYETGPVDPNAICREDDPTPCRVTLVR